MNSPSCSITYRESQIKFQLITYIRMLPSRLLRQECNAFASIIEDGSAAAEQASANGSMCVAAEIRAVRI